MRQRLIRASKRAAVAAVTLILSATGRESSSDYKWELPLGFTAPPVPASNPMTAEKAELGRHLFYDKRMSGNGRQSCGSCHLQSLAFTDGRARSEGSTGQLHPRSSMTLVNVAWSRGFTWANNQVSTLEEQMLAPMFGTQPVELGLEPGATKFLSVASRDKTYQRLFRQAFPADKNPFTLANVVFAIATFERTIISAESDWDFDWRQVQPQESAELSPPRTTAAARRGEALFFGEKLACGRCHGGTNFDTTFSEAGRPEKGAMFHNNGMPADVLGLGAVTGRADDNGKFKAPTMRNVGLTAPYMHDGRFATLEEVVDHYAKGGSHVPGQSPLIKGFGISPKEREDVVAFLRSLTDVVVARDPRFSDPWTSR